MRAGALALRAALPYAPAGVHLAVVDPGVGGRRRAVALRLGAEGRTMVGPDNGLLTLAAQELGGVTEAVDIGESAECLRPISATFHGRDVFAPVAAALAARVRDAFDPRRVLARENLRPSGAVFPAVPNVAAIPTPEGGSRG